MRGSAELARASSLARGRDEFSEEFASEGLFAVLRRRWVVMLLAICASLVAAAVYLTAARPLFTSSASLYVQQNGPRTIGGDPSAAAQSQPPANFLNTQR